MNSFKFLSDWIRTLRTYEDLIVYYYAEGSIIGNEVAMDNIVRTLAYFDDLPFKLTLYSKESYYFNLLNSKEEEPPRTPRRD
jgi:hypothetical protein